MIDQLKNYFPQVHPVEKNSYLPEPVSYHPDMQLFPAGDLVFLASGNPSIEDFLTSCGIQTKLLRKPESTYPGDVLCNGKKVGNLFFCNPKTIDPEIREYMVASGYHIVPVRQGYTGCSICAVDNHSLITADPSIALAAEKHGIDVLKIQPGFIDLPGYPYGFIGGCSGQIGNLLIFTGNLSSHPDGSKMRHFIGSKGLSLLELPNERLLDVGGILFVTFPGNQKS